MNTLFDLILNNNNLNKIAIIEDDKKYTYKQLKNDCCILFDKLVSKKGMPITQSIKSRIKQTLSSKKHTMSMLTDLKNKKTIEIKNQWKSLLKIDKSFKNKTLYSKKLYNSASKLI